MIICALFVLCCGAIFSACGEKNFDESKIVVGQTQYTYDGEKHMLSVDYEGKNPKVTYSLNNKKNFKSLNKFNFVNAGTYKLYYRLSADGYNTYTSKGYLELTIAPRDLEVSLFDYALMKSDTNAEIFFSSSTYGAIEGDDVGLEFVYEDGFDKENLQYGDTYEVGCTISNPNYNLVLNRTATLTVSDYVQITKADSTVNYYSNLQDAIYAAEEGETVTLNKNISVKDIIYVDKSITINGQGHSIVAAYNFAEAEYDEKTIKSIMYVDTEGVELTLSNITIDGNEVARGITMFDGKLTLDLASVINGRKLDDFVSGGVYIAEAASFVMNSGYIGNNDANDYEYTRFASDLYIQTSATTTATILDGRVDNVFVDAGEGKLTLTAGQIFNIYVEYKESQGATFEFTNGEVSNLMVSTTTTGESQEVEAVAGTTYVGGTDYTVTE